MFHALFTGDQIWTKRMYCMAENCNTKCDVFAVLSDTEDIEVKCKFNGELCVHLVGDLYGQLRGSARKEWAATRLRPHEMQLQALQSVSEDRILTGNLQNVPRLSSAKRLSSEERTGLRRDFRYGCFVA